MDGPTFPPAATSTKYVGNWSFCLHIVIVLFNAFNLHIIPYVLNYMAWRK